MAMTDEERMVDDFTDSRLRSNGAVLGWGGVITDETVQAQAREMSVLQIEMLRAKGYTLTPPPAPEPTYTIRLTEAMKSCGKHALANRYYSATNGWSDESALALYRMLEDATPDPEPGA